MTKRERFEKTVRHEQADRVPMDFAGMSLTGVSHPHVIEGVAALLGVEPELHAVQRALDTDFTNVGCIFNPDIPYNFSSPTRRVDCWGVERSDTGLYWDITRSPLRDADESDLDEFHWPQAAAIPQEEFDALREKAKRLYYDSDLVVIGEHPTYGCMELGCWMCGFDDFLYRLLAEPEFVEKFFGYVWQYQKDVIERYYEAVGPYIHLTSSGDDFGTQNGLFLSPDCFRELIAPMYKKRIALTKQLTKGYYFHHTCGSVFRLMDQFIEVGIDIQNPIQPGAFEMEPERLKAAYGDRLTFWGGIDEQQLLTHGTPEQVRAEVQRILSILWVDGGYVLSPSHNLQVDVPPENVVAMYEAAREFCARG